MEKKLVAAAVTSALAASMAAQAVEFAASGHINRAVVVVDKDKDPKDGDLQHTDGKTSPTRFRFKGSEELDNGLTVGGMLELGRTTDWRTRHAAFSLAGAFGSLHAGHTSNAADGMAFADGAFNGGSWLAGVTNSCAWVTNGPACKTNNGNFRQDILRYDSPALGPAMFSLSTGNDEYWDAKLVLAGDMGEAGYNFRVGYIPEYDKPVAAIPSSTTTYDGADFRKEYDIEEGASRSDITDAVKKVHEDRTVGWQPTSDGYTVFVDETPATTEKDGDILTMSAAVNFGQGTTIGAAWSRNDMPGDPTQEHEYTYFSVDQSYGDGSVGIHWKKGEISDSAAGMPDVEGTNWGIGWGHDIGGGATAYAGFRRTEEDGKPDTNLYLTGMRVTFN